MASSDPVTTTRGIRLCSHLSARAVATLELKPPSTTGYCLSLTKWSTIARAFLVRPPESRISSSSISPLIPPLELISSTAMSIEFFCIWPKAAWVPDRGNIAPMTTPSALVTAGERIIVSTGSARKRHVVWNRRFIMGSLPDRPGHGCG